MPTILKVAHAVWVEGLPGRSLLPLLEKEETPWRKYLFTEFHLHSAHNFYPQRTIRDDRFKLIWNLLPGELNPGFEFTNQRFFSSILDSIASAPNEVRQAYEGMRRPREFEFYDLSNDPHEFRDLSENLAYRKDLERLKQRLSSWREETADPFLDLGKLRRLQEEVQACFDEGTPVKKRLHLNYPEYFQLRR